MGQGLAEAAVTSAAMEVRVGLRLSAGRRWLVEGGHLVSCLKPRQQESLCYQIWYCGVFDLQCVWY